MTSAGAERRVELDPQRHSPVHDAGHSTPGQLGRSASTSASRPSRSSVRALRDDLRRSPRGDAVATACSNSGRAEVVRRPRRDEPADELALGADPADAQSTPHRLARAIRSARRLPDRRPSKPGVERAAVDVEVGRRLVEDQHRSRPLPRTRASPPARAPVIDRPVGFWKSGIRYAIDRQRARERLLGAVEVPPVGRRAPARRRAARPRAGAHRPRAGRSASRSGRGRRGRAAPRRRDGSRSARRSSRAPRPATSGSPAREYRAAIASRSSVRPSTS